MKNAQSNEICECIHQTVANVLRIMMRTIAITAYQQTKQIIDNALTTYICNKDCSMNHSMKPSPGALTFRRDILLIFPSWQISLQYVTEENK